MLFTTPLTLSLMELRLGIPQNDEFNFQENRLGSMDSGSPNSSPADVESPARIKKARPKVIPGMRTARYSI